MTTLTAGRALAALVPTPTRQRLQWRKVVTGELLDLGAEYMAVQVGPGSPYRLLLMHMGDDGLVRVSLFEGGRRGRWLTERKVLPDLLEFELDKLASEFALS